MRKKEREREREALAARREKQIKEISVAITDKESKIAKLKTMLKDVLFFKDDIAALQDEIEFSRRTDASTVRDKAPAVDPLDDLL